MAISILTSPDAVQTFTKSTTTFVQVAAQTHNTGAARIGASAQLARLAQQFDSPGIARLALELKSGGHFDKVIVVINVMIATLRLEEQGNIAHRNRCERPVDKRRSLTLPTGCKDRLDNGLAAVASVPRV